MSNQTEEAKFLVVAPPRGGFTLLISVLNELYRLKGIKRDKRQKKVNHFTIIAGKFVSHAIEYFFKDHIDINHLYYSGEFKLLAGGPKWVDPDDEKTVCVRKYLGVKDMGDVTFVQYHPRFVLDFDDVVHSHVHPKLWVESPDFAGYRKLTSIRNPIDILHSSIYSLNALTSEYIQRCAIKQDASVIRRELAMFKFSDINFMEGMIIYLVNYLKEFMSVKDRFLYMMKWEDIIGEPTKTILEVSKAAGMEVGEATADGIWEKIRDRNLMRWHKHNYRKGVLDDWKTSITNSHLKLFEEYNFNDYLNAFGYERIKCFDESEYTDTQREIEGYLKSGQGYKKHDDENLFLFSFNKTNFSPSKNASFQFKTYDRMGDFKLERSCFKDEPMLLKFMAVMQEAIGTSNVFLTEIWDGGDLEQVKDKYRDTFLKVFPEGERGEYDDAFDDFSRGYLANTVPVLIEATKTHNIVQMGERFFAIPKAIGPVDLTKQDPAGLPNVIVCTSLEDARAKTKRRWPFS